jgi:sulfoxide reductase heme-binding subunit YedZ
MSWKLTRGAKVRNNRMPMLPWTDRNGALSPLKAPVFVALFLPGLWLISAFFLGHLGPRPFTELEHQSGLWTIRLLFLTLAVTPLRRLLRWPELISVRRMIGVAAMVYALFHFGAYVADQAFDLSRVASEIVLRLYLLVGIVALLALIPLGITSTNAMIRRLGGRRWRRLHQSLYVIAVLGMIHYFWQAKFQSDEAAVMGGLLLWLYGYRAAEALGGRPPLPLAYAGALAIAAAVLTALGEAAYFRLRFNVDGWRLLDADISFAAGWRPAWYVLAICMGVTVAAAMLRARRRPRAAPARSIVRSGAAVPERQ